VTYQLTVTFNQLATVPSDGPDTLTLADVANKFLADKATEIRPATLREYTRLLQRDAMPVLGTRSAGDVKPVDVKRLLEGIKGQGSKINVYAVLRHLYEWAISELLIEPPNPVAALKRPKRPAKLPRVLTDDELRLVCMHATGCTIMDVSRAFSFSRVADARRSAV
jgi:site-specific recombinase XerD